MTTSIPTQRHPAVDLADPSSWRQANFCPCDKPIPWSQSHCDNQDCIDAHNTAERLLDMNGDPDND